MSGFGVFPLVITGKFWCKAHLCSNLPEGFKTRFSWDKNIVTASKLAQQLKTLASKPGNLSSIHGTHMIEGENYPPEVVFWPLTCVVTHTCEHIQREINIKIFWLCSQLPHCYNLFMELPFCCSNTTLTHLDIIDRRLTTGYLFHLT